MFIKIINEIYFRSKDQYFNKYPCEIGVYFVHNHILSNDKTVRHRNPSKKLKNIFLKYYSNNHFSLSALEIHNINLQQKYDNEYFKIIADGLSALPRSSAMIYITNYLNKSMAH